MIGDRDMYNRKFKLKAFGHVIFRNESGELLAKARVHCDSKSHREGVIKSMLGSIRGYRFLPVDDVDMNVVENVIVEKGVERDVEVRHPSRRG